MTEKSRTVPKNNLTYWINRLEERWLKALSDRARDVFSGTFLPSHDHTHHLRTWNIAKILLRELAESGLPLDEALVEGLMVSVWFHDLGMAVTRDMEHGAAGRQICEEYFRNGEIPEPARFGEVLEAIEKHDIKDDRERMGIGYDPDMSPGILELLSLADDMEALGIIGIYRYAEIYLARGTGFHELGDMVLGNATNRFDFIAASLSRFSGPLEAFQREYGQREAFQREHSLLESSRKEYELLEVFYRGYNRQLDSLVDPEKAEDGPVGVANMIRRLTLEGRIRPEYIAELIGDGKSDPVVLDFFLDLSQALARERLN